MADICNKCGKMIIDDFEREVIEKKGKLREFHKGCSHN